MKNSLQFKSMVKSCFPFLAIFAITFFFFSLFEFNKKMPLFSGEDSFYHVGMAKYISQNGIPQKFPTLFFTTLNEKFVDHQLLFHLTLIPFIKIFGENIGPKILNITFIALAFSFLYLIFRQKKLYLSWFYPLLLLISMPSDFYFRMAFIRVQAAALFFMTAAIFFIISKKYLWLGIFAFLFVWLYGGSIFMPGFILLYFISQLLTGEKIDWKIISFGLGGFILGLTINPYFPKNIHFLYSQIFQTGIGAKSYSGGEWHPYDSWYWFSISLTSIIIFFGGILLVLAKHIKLRSIDILLVTISIFFLILQWKSKRFVEYWPFFGALAGIFLAAKYFEEKSKIFSNSKAHIAGGAISMSILMLLVGYKANIEITHGYNDTATPIDLVNTKSVNQYLLDNSRAGEIIFTDDWDMFPFYFYFNQKNNYIVGLDPEFMNQFDHTLYEEYAAISSGLDGNNLERIKADFKASWVLVSKDHPEFRYNLISNPELFEKSFDNSDYTLFKVK